MSPRILRRFGLACPWVLTAALAGFGWDLAAPPAARAHEPLGVSLDAVSRSIEAEPAHAGLRLRRAELRRLAGRFDEAALDLDLAESLDPRLSGLARARAALALDRGEPLAALAALDSAPAPEDEPGERWQLRARALSALGRGREAIAAWSAALGTLERVEPEHYLERARLQVAADRFGEARAGLAEGIARLGATISLTHALDVLRAEGADAAGEAASAGPETDAALAGPGAVGSSSGAGPGIDAITITRGPWLQRATPTAVTVRWRTLAAGNSRVWFGTAPGVYSTYVDDATSTTEHEIALSGLTPDTRYWYTVGSTTEVGAGGDSLTFRTHPLAGADVPVRIWVLGDSGIPGAAQNAVRDAFTAWTGEREADVWLMLGDNAYNTGLDSEFQNGLFTPYRQLLRRWTLWPTRGNHDVVRSGANNDYYEFFTLPTAAEAGGTPSGTEAYYSFDYGPVHFVCLDSEGSSRAVGGAMLTWLAADLAANTRPWTIAYFHHPPYTKGSHDSDDAADSGGRMRDMRQNALPILEAGGVDLVLTGHSHSYERSFLLDGHYGLSGTLTPAMKLNPGDGRADGDGPYAKPTFGPAPHEGAVHAVDGSGAQISGGTLDHPAMVSSLNVLGSMIVDVDGERMDARFLSNLGVVRDSFTILKGAATAVRGGDLDSGGLRLGAALPNPFRNGLSLSFALAVPSRVRLEVFDAAGRRVATLASGERASGTHSAYWDGTGEDGRPLPAGIYLAALEAEGRRVARRIALVR